MTHGIEFLDIKVIFVTEFSEVVVDFLWTWHQVLEKRFELSVYLVFLLNADLHSWSVETVHHVVELSKNWDVQWLSDP